MPCHGVIRRVGGLSVDFAVDSHNESDCSSSAATESDSSDSSSDTDDRHGDRCARLLVAQENGIVKWYDPHRGYGFLVRPDGSELFVHRQRVVMAAGEAPLLRARTQLSFDVCRSPHGRLEAQNVRTTWGRPISNRVSGKRYSLIRREFHEHHDLSHTQPIEPIGSATLCGMAESNSPQTATLGHYSSRQAAVRPRYPSWKPKESREHCADGKS